MPAPTQAPAAPAIGSLPAGPRNAITDVPGVTVGHCTLAQGACQTGVTVVRPHGGNVYTDKVPAAAMVLNGFGKSIGLVQVDELGVLETPIALTNTFSVGTIAQAQIRDAIAVNPEIGRGWPTVNPLVFECNDGYLNDIQAMAVGQSHYVAALAGADADVPQGAVGAGRGISAFGVKGGIGTASRVVCGYTVGALVLANFGTPESLLVGGAHVGARLTAKLAAQLSEQLSEQLAGKLAGKLASEPAGTMAATFGKGGGEGSAEPEKGSIIMIIATDAPLDARQLRRVSLRAGAGLARTGSVFGHGSGDIALAFSTAYTVPHLADAPMPALAMVHETRLDPLFRAAADSVEQAIVHALWFAEAVEGRDGHRRQALRDLVPDFKA